MLPAVARCAAARFDLLALVKPQFELGRGRVGKGGVVRRPEDRLEALVRRRRGGPGARALGAGLLSIRAARARPGNRESFIWCAGGVPEGVDDLVAAARAAEPEAAEPAGARR